MLRNLNAEIARYGYNATDIANAIKVSDRTARTKISGESEFTFPEAMTIRDKLFPAIKLEYLFKDDTTTA